MPARGRHSSPDRAPITSSSFAGPGRDLVSELRRAISIRQPFAWAIIHGGKDIENRNQRAAFQFKPAIGERVLIHASKEMTAAEYENAAAFMANTGVRCPQREALQFGGVIGSVFVRDVVARSDSPWFRKGATALVFAEARPEPFMPVRGQTGLFRV